MMGSEPPTTLQVTPDVRQQAESIVARFVHELETGGVVVLVDELTAAIAEALQWEVNRSELAEIERRRAVANMQNLGARIRELGAHVVAESWAVCSRCGVRAPTLADLLHAPGCTLSTRPPPRLSLVAPRMPPDEEPPP